MPQRCIFRCQDAQKLFSFPHACPKRMNIWAKRLGISTKIMTKNQRVCEKHFDSKYIGKKYLLLEAVPEQRVIDLPKTDTSIEVARSKVDSRFEAIYFTPDATQEHIPPKAGDIQDTVVKTEPGTDSSEDIENTSSEISAIMEPVDTTFKEPPKRTYGHSNNLPPKKPKLDITATCYCRCHKGENEKEQLNRKIEEMKVTIADQTREINLLLSKNKVSEHLLRGKVKKISDLQNLETSLRKAIEALNLRVSIMSKRQIKAAPNASENSIILARMVCDKRKKYTKSEVIVANKLYAISGRCYYFMRDVLKLNLPHPTTLLRNRNIFSPVNEEQTNQKEFDCNELIEQDLEQELEDPIVFYPEPVEEENDEELQLDVDN